MDHNTTTKLLDLQNKTDANLEDLANTYIKKHGPPDDSHYDGAKHTLFGWAADGKGVWVLPSTKANFESFEYIARPRPDLGHDTHSHCEIMRLAGAEFFADWRDSDRARAVKEAEPKAMQEGGTARYHS